jgi:hypothetical protein
VASETFPDVHLYFGLCPLDARSNMFKIDTAQTVAMLVTFGVLSCTCNPASADVRIEGQVQAGAAPVANSTVTLWAASASEPKQLAQTTTNNDGRFELNSQESIGQDISLYVIAKGGETAVNKGSGNNPAAALLAVLGNAPPPKVVVDEMTTLASVITHTQFIDGTSIKGPALALRVARATCPTSLI